MTDEFEKWEKDKGYDYIAKCLKCGYEYIEGQAYEGDEVSCPKCGAKYFADWDGDYGGDEVFGLYLIEEDYPNPYKKNKEE